MAAFPDERPILAVGADLKNTITLVVDGQAFVSQHIGDLGITSRCAFQETVQDLISMYEVRVEDLLVVHDAHPQYVSTAHATALGAPQIDCACSIIAPTLPRCWRSGAMGERVAGVSFDGTGYGDDGNIWGGEIFVGSVREGFERVAHLRSASSARR